MKKLLVFGSIVLKLGFTAFITKFSDKPVAIPPSKQRAGGDAAKGYEYLVIGDYVRSGIPYNIFLFGNGRDTNNYLQRTGLNKNISHQYNTIKASNNEILVAPNCLQCHAQVFENSLVLGLGNSLVDFTLSEKLTPQNFELLENILKKNAPRQYEAAAHFLTVSKSIAPYIQVPIKGVNMADHLTAILAAHRDRVTFRWRNEAQLTVTKDVVPTDTPPWWLLKKKNGMFYNGFGRGDFGRFLMGSNLLTVNDTSESRQVDEHMPDVLAYIYSLKPPVFPKAIDPSLAATGRKVFEQTCSGCHGTYGEKWTYPNLLIPQSIIGTDSLLCKTNYSSPQFLDWFNKSWFTTGDHPARLEPFNGYIAPPLDGIWITAPYFHNGSVPDLEGVLNSKTRPQYWSRNFDNPEYRYDVPGWKFTTEQKGGDKSTYNTTIPGYRNTGHNFGDHLSAAERRAVIEYLKTL